jgi:hypothetical protein
MVHSILIAFSFLFLRFSAGGGGALDALRASRQ